jgi:hypothetical protein
MNDGVQVDDHLAADPVDVVAAFETIRYSTRFPGR